MDKRIIAIELGLEAEKVFELECIKRKIPIYKSVGVGQTDYIIGNLKPLRVQIKSTDNDSKLDIPIKCSWGSYKTSGWKPYTKQETDIIALYLRKRQDWYLIPVEEVNTILGFNISESCRFQKYKNNWNINNEDIVIEDSDTIKKEKILNLHAQGKNTRQITLETGYGRAYVNIVLRLSGITLKSKLEKITEEALKKLYLEDKLTMEQIAVKFNVSTTYIRERFREYKISVRVNNNPAGNKGGQHFT